MDLSRYLVERHLREGTPVAELAAAHSVHRRGGTGAMESELCALGITFEHSRPYHPQTCGKIERFHQTQKKFLTKQDPAATIRTLQH